MGIKIRVALLTAIAISGVSVADAQRVVPACTAAEEKLWQRSQDTLGLFVVDSGRQIGGAASVVKFDDNGIKSLLNPLLAGYHPASSFKELACGTLDKWSLYVLPPNERDLHPHIKLSPNYTHLIKDAPLGNGVSGDDCDGCIFGEVTVPREFEWFWKEGAKGKLSNGSNACGSENEPCANKTMVLTTDAKFCAYGPWIMEKAHRYWPEIHPVQAFWGQASDHASLFVVDDDSQRFQQESHFGLRHLSPKGAIPWGGAFDGTLYQVVRIDAKKGASVRWKDDRESLAKPPINTGAGQIAFGAPSWIDASLASACSTGNQTQAIIQARIPFTSKQRWRALDISGVDTGIRYGRGTPPPSTSPAPKTESEPRWSATTKIGWDDNRNLSVLTSNNLAEAAKEWNVSPTDTQWFGVARQELEVRPEVFEGDRNALLTSLHSEWTVTIVDLNNRAVVPSNGFRVQLRHPRNLPPTVKGPITPVASNATDYRLTVLFNAPQVPANSGRFRFENLKVSVKLRLSTPQASFDHEIDIYSIVPDFIAQVAGYNLVAQKGAFPPKLSEIIAPWLVARGCRTVTRATWNSDLEGKATPDLTPAPLWALLNRRLRTAGVVWQTVNLALADSTLDANEFHNLMSGLGKYRDACIADPPKP